MSEIALRPFSRWPVAVALAGALLLPLLVGPAATGRPAPSGGKAHNFAGEVSGRATVIDGDTLDVDGRRVRLEGIDAPETAQSCGRRWFGTWACGQAAAKALSQLVDGRRITCRSTGHDAYGRVLGVCNVDATDLNAEMVRRGMAWAFVKYSRSYVAEEAAAREARAGIWQGEAEPAWIFRANRWQSAETAAPSGCAIKGNVTGHGRIYHMPWSPWYGRVKVDAARGERWFCSETEAREAGWRAAAAR